MAILGDQRSVPHANAGLQLVCRAKAGSFSGEGEC